MTVQIQVDQSGKPAGTPGRAREDLVTGTAVTLSAIGGPFARYLWSIIHKPIDPINSVRATCLLGTPQAATSLLSPIDVPGTYDVQVAVDSGSGLGAGPNDLARMSFYAGTVGSRLLGPLASSPIALPRRIPAFREGLEHNVLDGFDPVAGNAEGWSREMYRWLAVIAKNWESKAWALGRVTVAGGGPATLVRGVNVSGVNWNSTGVVTVSLSPAMPDSSYLAIGFPLHAAGEVWCDTEGTGSFKAHRTNSAGSVADLDFGFAVYMGVP